MSKYTLLELLASRTAAPVTEALLRCLGAHPDLVHTLTADNGKEFAGHREVSAGLEAGFCLATPCHSWERGLNEHANGLVRQYFPKGTGLTRVTAEEVRQVEDRLNRRPRKVPGCARSRRAMDACACRACTGPLQCRTASPAMLESRDCRRFGIERTLPDPGFPPCLPMRLRLHGQTGAVLHFGLELGRPFTPYLIQLQILLIQRKILITFEIDDSQSISALYGSCSGKWAESYAKEFSLSSMAPMSG